MPNVLRSTEIFISCLEDIDRLRKLKKKSLDGSQSVPGAPFMLHDHLIFRLFKENKFAYPEKTSCQRQMRTPSRGSIEKVNELTSNCQLINYSIDYSRLMAQGAWKAHGSWPRKARRGWFQSWSKSLGSWSRPRALFLIMSHEP